MTAVVYDYPKSSCNCYSCEGKAPPSLGEGRPSPMSVRGCKIPDYYSCDGNNVEFSSGLGPTSACGIDKMNVQVYADNRASGFIKNVCDGSMCEISYDSLDPRLINAPRWSTLALDAPPIDGSIRLDYINHDKKLDGYGQNYTGYSDINAGQIMYYTDKSVEGPFVEPVFASTANVTGYVYRDPMGAMKPHYQRTPLTCNNPITESRCDGFEGGLSWLRDSNNQREEIVALQMAKMNQSKWGARWGSES